MIYDPLGRPRWPYADSWDPPLGATYISNTITVTQPLSEYSLDELLEEIARRKQQVEADYEKLSRLDLRDDAPAALEAPAEDTND